MNKKLAALAVSAAIAVLALTGCDNTSHEYAISGTVEATSKRGAQA